MSALPRQRIWAFTASRGNNIKVAGRTRRRLCFARPGKTVRGRVSGAFMRIGADNRHWTCVAFIGIAAFCFVGAAAADDGEQCVKGSGSPAIDACTRAINSNRFDQHNLAIIYSNRANQRERIGDFEKAIADHNEAIKIDPTYAAGFMHRGNAYARHSDFDRAIADHTEAVRLAPKDADFIL